jgi:hypothetical protein
VQHRRTFHAFVIPTLHEIGCVEQLLGLTKNRKYQCKKNFQFKYALYERQMTHMNFKYKKFAVKFLIHFDVEIIEPIAVCLSLESVVHVVSFIASSKQTVSFTDHAS